MLLECLRSNYLAQAVVTHNSTRIRHPTYGYPVDKVTLNNFAFWINSRVPNNNRLIKLCVKKIMVSLILWFQKVRKSKE